MMQHLKWSDILSLVISGVVGLLWISYITALIGVIIIPPNIIGWVDQIFQFCIGGYILLRFGFQTTFPFIRFGSLRTAPMQIEPWEIRIMRIGGLFIMSKYITVFTSSGEYIKNIICPNC